MFPGYVLLVGSRRPVSIPGPRTRMGYDIVANRGNTAPSFVLHMPFPSTFLHGFCRTRFLVFAIQTSSNILARNCRSTHQDNTTPLVAVSTSTTCPSAHPEYQTSKNISTLNMRHFRYKHSSVENSLFFHVIILSGNACR